MARPKSNPKDLHNKDVRIYFTESEYEKIKQFISSFPQSKNNNVGTFVRNVILNTIEKKDIKFEKVISNEYLFELRKIGINLNQIARKINVNDESYKWEHEKINELLGRIIDILNQENE